MREPTFESRRRKELADELINRARVWLADWHPPDSGDFAVALFKIAARLESEVTQRLDKVPAKTFRGFLDWLGVKGKPGLAARLPVVFTMTPGSDPVDAPSRVQLQISTADAPVTFETERPLRILPGALATIVAVDPAADAFFRPPAGIFPLEAPKLVPNAWQLKSDAPLGATTLQLDPPIGFDIGVTLSDPLGQQYRIVDVKGAIVTVEPPVGTTETKGTATPVAATALAAGTTMKRVDVFAPFGPTERNRQEHVLFIGSDSGLNIDAAAAIAIQGGATIPQDVTWWHSGKPSPTNPGGWVQLKNVSKTPEGELLLNKPKGAIEKTKVDGYDSRWLKAVRAPGNIGQPSTSVALRLLVNCGLPDADWPTVTALEGIANTAPLVLDAGFYPFGREPRQFDSFYLGSKEALSKPSAKVILHFELGDTVRNARAAIGLSDTEYRTFGVSDDGRLQRIDHGVTSASGVTLPTLTFKLPAQPAGDNQRPITLNANLRPGTAVAAGVPHVTVSAGNEVWLWKDVGGRDDWQSLGKPFASAAKVTATVITHSGATDLAVYAVADGKVYRRIVGGADWLESVVPVRPLDVVDLIAPVVPIQGRAGEQSEADGVVAVSHLGDMFLFDAGAWTMVNGGPAAKDPTFYPLVVHTSALDRLCVTRDDNNQPVAFDLTQMGPGTTAAVELRGHALDFVAQSGTELVAVLVAIDPSTNAPALAVWDAFADAPLLFDTSGHQPIEAPVAVSVASTISRFMFVPVEDGKVYITPVGEAQFLEDAAVTDVALFTDGHNWAMQSDLLIDIGGAVDTRAFVVEDVLLAVSPDRWVFTLDQAGTPAAGSHPVNVFHTLNSQPRTGTWRALRKLELEAGDPGPGNPAAATLFVYVKVDGKTRVIRIAQQSNDDLELTANMPAANDGDSVEYRICETSSVAATLNVERLPGVDISALAPPVVAALTNGALEIQDSPLTPRSQRVRYAIASTLAVLNAPWDARPADDTFDFFALVEVFSVWTPFEPPTPRNPTLSWEYYDGTAWRPIPRLTDKTEALAKAGNVEFCVPKDIKATDVVGRTNSWIRARLVGGDFGQETVTISTVPPTPPATSAQVVTRSSDNIRAPYVGSLTVKYEVCCPVTPDVVLALDNGVLRNQTEVNRSAGAIVEYFVPLSHALARAAGQDPASSPPGDASDRALFVGFDTKLTGGPIQILFLVDEGTHDAAFPLRVDALVDNRFKPLVITDYTRGLNESGVIELFLNESPQLTAPFGGTAQYWLRVRPGPRLVTPNDWQPKIRAAYLNATWAIAAETQAIERLGSSDGSPNQAFRLARRPVIEKSLRLRVLERLGDEEIDELRAKRIDVQKTLDNVPERDGHWVLWTQAVDPADEAADARVYALDDATGTITFGDGLHGKIPPIGQDVILAESYQRGGGEAANRIAAWTKINLVTALGGIKKVEAPEGAAGGSDPQDAAETLRFAPANLRLRDRALTLADLEMLALQFSRDIAQVRALPTTAGVRLVVIMRGRTATPRAAVVRELRAHLLNQASPMLAATGVLAIIGPREVLVRIDLRVIVDAIESSGQVANEARERLATLLDPANGGHDRVGWPLGEMPSDTDIAAALVGVPRLEGLLTSTVTRLDGQAITRLKPTELVRLAPDGVTLAPVLETEAVV